jgi:hypothetical protein
MLLRTEAARNGCSVSVTALTANLSRSVRTPANRVTLEAAQ